MIIKKRRRQIKSFPTVEIIETNSKYIEINSLLNTIKFVLQGILGETH